MSLRQVVDIVNKRGLHARAAAKFAQLADSFDAEITVTHKKTSVPGNSIMGLMMLAAAPGCSIEIHTEGSEAEQAMAALRALVERRFDED